MRGERRWVTGEWTFVHNYIQFYLLYLKSQYIGVASKYCQVQCIISYDLEVHTAL